MATAIKSKEARKAEINVQSQTTFRKSDVKRAILAAESAGMKVGRVEVDKAGRIALMPDNGAQATSEGQEVEPSEIIL